MAKSKMAKPGRTGQRVNETLPGKGHLSDPTWSGGMEMVYFAEEDDDG